MYTANGYDLKWGVSKKGNIEYYQKEEGAKDWKLEKNDTAIFDIAGKSRLMFNDIVKRL